MKACLAIALAALPTQVAAESVVKISGRLQDSSVERLIRAMASRNIDAVVISSVGGSEVAGLKLGQFLRSRNIKLVIDGVCMSSCAQYVMLQAPTVEIRNGSLIAFHSSSYAMNRWSGAHRRLDPLYASLHQASAPISQAIASALTSAQLSLLERAFGKLRPACIEPSVSPGGSPRVRLRAHLWVPTKADLQAAGVAVPGSWPSTPDQALSLARRYVKADAVVSTGAGNIAPPVRALPRCTR